MCLCVCSPTFNVPRGMCVYVLRAVACFCMLDIAFVCVDIVLMCVYVLRAVACADSICVCVRLC
jgi:hypothetical protein